MKLPPTLYAETTSKKQKPVFILFSPLQTIRSLLFSSSLWRTISLVLPICFLLNCEPVGVESDADITEDAGEDSSDTGNDTSYIDVDGDIYPGDGETDTLDGDSEDAETDAFDGDVDSGDGGTDASDAEVDTGPDPDRCLDYEEPNQLIADRHFQRGFININPATSIEISQMPSGLCPDPPIWQFAFGNSQTTLPNQPRVTLGSGAVSWDDTYARMVIGPGGTPEVDLTLAVWGYEQYGGTYYVPAPLQGWVYHLAQQQISVPGVYTHGSPPISSLDRLDFNIFARLLYADQNIQSGYDPNHHAAQYLIYFTIQNQNQSNPGFGDYLWFGLSVYDDRTPVLGLTVMQDIGGTDRLIYNLGSEPFVSQGFTPGGPGMLFEGDLLPAIRDALTRAWANGFLTGSNELSDYRIGGMNIGWEVPGLNDVEMQVRDLSLLYERKVPAPVEFNFNTDGDREGWTAVNISELSDGPLNGFWIFNVLAPTPMLTSPVLAIEAATHSTIRIIVANNQNPIGSSILKVYWDRFGDKGFREAWSKSVAINNNGGFQTIDINMNTPVTPGWVGEIHKLRIDPIFSGDGHSVGIDMIAILP
jgi:hypothetical protein